MFKVKNWFDFSNIKDVAEGLWTIEAGGRKIASGKIPALDVAAGGEKEFRLELPDVAYEPEVEYFLNLSFQTKTDAPMVKRGYEIAWEQFKLPVYREPFVMKASSLQAVKVVEDDSVVTLSGEDFAAEFDKGKGTISSLRYKGKELLARGPLPDFWRAFTDNDARPLKRRRYSKIWRKVGPGWQVRNVTVRRKSAGVVSIEVKGELPDVKGVCTVTYSFCGNGEIEVFVKYEPGEKIEKLKGPHRFGMELVAVGGLEKMSWFGRGPRPTYCDRKFERVGLFSSTVDTEWVDYSRPQENGNKVDVRWVALTDDTGTGLLFKGEPLVSVGAKHYSKEQMQKCRYSFQMHRSEDIYVNIDMAQLGVGGINSWGATALDEYRLENEAMSYRFRMRGFDGGIAGAEVLMKQWLEVSP